MEEIFTNIYQTKLWGDNKNTEYNGSSGSGSCISYNKDTYVPFLKKFIIDNNIKNVVDLGCGDFECGKLIYDDLDVLYTGYDAYKKIIEYNSNQYSLSKYSFKHLDFCNNKEEIINGDLCILKDVIQHWSLENIYIFLDYLVDCKKFKYVLICNCCNQIKDNTDIINGDFRHLSCYYFPLKKYNPTKLYSYDCKEVSVITIDAELNKSVSSIPVIPLKIFQTWNTKILPEKMQIVVDDLKSKNSEFEYFLFDDNDCEEFIKNNFGEDVLHAYDTLIPGAYKADLWRCCVLYIYGGIYLDIKYQCVNDFKLITLTDKEYFVTDELMNYISGPYKGIIWNGLMISKPKNERLLKCINQIVENVENKYYGFGIYEPTGPTLLTRYFSVEERKSNILTRAIDRSQNYNGAKMNDTFILNEYDDYRIDRKKSVIDYTTAWLKKYVYKIPLIYSTYYTRYGLITLYSNDIYINKEFIKNKYWNENILLKIKKFINPKKNILVIGGHCGSSSIALSSFIENEQKIYVYEPQEKLYKLLIKNIQENSLQDKIIPHNMGIFCFDGEGTMNNIDLDCGNGIISKRYNEEYYLPCNFAGATLGQNGEIVELTTLNTLDTTYDNIGCIYCSAQGSESFIFSKSINFITKNRPVIYFENNKKNYSYQYDKIIENYSQFKEDGEFDIIDYCIKNLNYTLNRNLFDGETYILLVPN